MDNLREWFFKIATDTGVWLQSETALVLYSWLGIIAVLAISAMVAGRLLRIIKDFNGADLLVTISGQGPRRSATINKRIHRLQTHAASTSKTIARHALGLFSVGIIIPGIVLGFIAAQQEWFMPGVPALVLEGMPSAYGELGYPDLALFVVDQALRGGLSDFFEVFGVALSGVQNNPGNLLFSSLTLFYRFLSGVVFAAILFVTARIILGIRRLRDKINMLEEKKQTAG